MADFHQTTRRYIQENRIRHGTVCRHICNGQGLVGMAAEWTATVRFPAGTRDFSLFHNAQAGCGPTSLLYMGTGGLSLGSKVAEV
jgi:hypothetical protein